MIQNKEAMETNFNFKSAICTSKEQSERLLALGIKKETADMHHSYYTRVSFDGSKSHFWKEETGYSENAIPAWSLHRLIELRYGTNWIAIAPKIHIERVYDDFIDAIEEGIKKGYFNEEYLV